jgi:hypothetical protein
MVGTQTVFGSLDQYEMGGVEVIDDSPKRYAFSTYLKWLRGPSLTTEWRLALTSVM